MSITVQSHLAGTDRAQALADDVRSGLTASPKSLPPKWFYDERGSALFDEITRLPEYYPTDAERSVLRERAAEIVARSGADTLVELGSGTSEKTRLLLDAFAAAGRLERFVPFDVDPTILQQAGEAVAAEYPGTQVQAVAGDFERHLDRLPVTGHRLVAFLGSTIGNLEPRPRAQFLTAIAAGLRPGDAFLLGTDLVKEPGRLVAAYDDAAGVTAQFNKNVLRVVNRELAADFDLDGFEHVARWDERDEWMEMLLRSVRAQTVRVGALDLQVEFAAGELMRTEVSAKFRQSGVRRELAAAGLETQAWWTDPRGDFAVSLSTLR
ncbi:L-histidine N(alpha)-methyltransferase [Angustibacter sp. McL0619]|uniref:L-histidine N(alpha)-methyltransferase n=1 Tax=Angustibacter sp. McL0619 TaxID=3415676 RepID=UPI003CEDBAF8